MSPSKRRLDGLDTLRALAIVRAFVFVLAHPFIVFVSGTPTFGWVSENGWVGIDLFFVLSGCLIANQIVGGMARGGSLRQPTAADLDLSELHEGHPSAARRARVRGRRLVALPAG